jgi:hypothetical protein
MPLQKAGHHESRMVVPAGERGRGVSLALFVGAIIWLNMDRKRLIEDNNKRSERLEALADRIITVSTELKTYLFSERKA